MAQMTGSAAVLQALRQEGVEVVFGLPGVQIMGLYDAFYAQSDMRLITVRHEQTTAYMADGYARVTGRPGVALVVPGPGVQNASAALGTAYSASSPVLLLAGQVESYTSAVIAAPCTRSTTRWTSFAPSPIHAHSCGAIPCSAISVFK